MIIGANLVLKTVLAIEENNYPQIDQAELIANGEQEKHAPKLFKDDCKIDWSKNATAIHNFIRGLSPYPTAFSAFVAPDEKSYSVKLFKTEKEIIPHTYIISTILTDSKSFLKIAVKEGYIIVHELQLAGKKKMATTEFLRGFPMNNDWKAIS